MSIEAVKVVVIDSGLGGVLFASHMMEAFFDSYNFSNHFELIHIYDNKNFPYGNKTPECIKKISEDNLAIAHSFNPDVIFFGCNTSSAILSQYELFQPKVNFILKPSARALYSFAVEVSEEDTVNLVLIATPATIASGAFQKEIRELHDKGSSCHKGLNIHTIAPMQWASTVEQCSNEVAIQLIEDDFKMYTLTPFYPKECLAVGLFCTHYPIARDRIQGIMPVGGRVFSQGELFTKTILEACNNKIKVASPRINVNIVLTEPCQNFDKDLILQIYKNLPVIPTVRISR